MNHRTIAYLTAFACLTILPAVQASPIEASLARPACGALPACIDAQAQDFGHCGVSVGNCTEGGYCKINLAGYCTSWCSISIASYCQGACFITVASVCGEGEGCLAKVAGFCPTQMTEIEARDEAGCEVGVPSLCVVDLGGDSCNHYGNVLWVGNNAFLCVQLQESPVSGGAELAGCNAEVGMTCLVYTGGYSPQNCIATVGPGVPVIHQIEAICS